MEEEEKEREILERLNSEWKEKWSKELLASGDMKRETWKLTILRGKFKRKRHCKN